jgi:DNA modification methylase
MMKAIKDYTLHHGDCLEILAGMPDRSVDLVFTSPPYEAARTYGIGFKLKGQNWVDWLAERIVAAARVSKGLVVVNVSSPKDDGIYSGGVERLAADRSGGMV